MNETQPPHPAGSSDVVMRRLIVDFFNLGMLARSFNWDGLTNKPMTTETRQYYDTEGNPCSLVWLVRHEPEWAANQIRHRDKLEEDLLQEQRNRAAECATLTKDCNMRGDRIRELQALLRQCELWFREDLPEAYAQERLIEVNKVLKP